MPGHEEGDFSSEGVKSRLEAELRISRDGKLETLCRKIVTGLLS